MSDKMLSTKLACQVAICSKVGQREAQEDRVNHWVGKDDSRLLILCDGAGGHGGGAEASAAAIDAAEKLWEESNEVIEDAPDFLRSWVKAAHEAVNEAGERSGQKGRVVVVAAVVREHVGYWVHAGDCRLYHLRGSEILKRTRDDSVVQVLYERGDLTEEEMGSHPDQNRLLQSLGGKEVPTPREDSGALLPGDRLLLCSDGLWEFLEKDEIARIGRSDSLAAELEKAVSESISRAGDRADNTSAAILRLDEVAGESPRSPRPVPVLIIALCLLNLILFIVLLILIL